MMRMKFSRLAVLWTYLLVVGLATPLIAVGPATRTAEAKQEYFSGAGACATCHATPTVATCQGCHAHGTHPNTGMTDMNVAGATNKNSYAPGETVSVTITGGHQPDGQNRWIRAILYDQNMQPLARSTGTGVPPFNAPGGGPGYPITLSAPAPTTPGTYTWTVAWFGNQFDRSQVLGKGTTVFGPGWTPNSSPNPLAAGHGEERVATNSFTVTVPAPAIQLNPASLAFGTVNTGSAVTLTTEIQNTGSMGTLLNVSTIALAGQTSTEYTFQPGGALTIPAGGNIVLSVTYKPTNAGTDTGSLVLTSNASPSQTPLSLTGTGNIPLEPAISLSLGALDFGTVVVGGVPAVRTTQIQNTTGTAELIVSAIAPAVVGTLAEYTFTPPPPIIVAAGTETPLSVTYTPIDAGTDTGSLVLTSNAATSPILSLTGTGIADPQSPDVPKIVLTPATLDFGTVEVNGPSGQLTATIQNTGTAPLEVTGIALCPGTSGEFAWSPGTPLTVATGGSTPLNVSYTPADAVADAGCLAIASNDPTQPSVTLAVAGTGTMPPEPPVLQPVIDVTPTALSFGTVVVGGTVSKTTNIVNRGSAPLHVSDIGLCNGTSAEFSYTPDTLTLDPGAQQMVTVTYAPTQAGAHTGCMTIASDDLVTPSVPVNVTANGIMPPPPGGLSIEIEHFQATEKVRIGKQVKFKLEIENDEDSSGQASATLVGIQDGVEVYNQTITVLVEPETEEATWTFPPYTATTAGKIMWTVTIVDESSATNQATATTKVTSGKERETNKEEREKKKETEKKKQKTATRVVTRVRSKR